MGKVAWRHSPHRPSRRDSTAAALVPPLAAAATQAAEGADPVPPGYRGDDGPKGAKVGQV